MEFKFNYFYGQFVVYSRIGLWETQVLILYLYFLIPLRFEISWDSFSDLCLFIKYFLFCHYFFKLLLFNYNKQRYPFYICYILFIIVIVIGVIRVIDGLSCAWGHCCDGVAILMASTFGYSVDEVDNAEFQWVKIYGSLRKIQV